MRELELREKELEMKDKEMQLQLKLKELELRKTMSSPSDSSPSASISTSFDVSRQVWLVPQFHEEEVDKCFLHFEKVATTLHWPTEVCTMLLQSVLVGKAPEVYSALSVEQSADYKLVPEAYRQQFCELKRKEGQTYMEFAGQKEVLFNSWCT